MPCLCGLEDGGHGNNGVVPNVNQGVPHNSVHTLRAAPTPLNPNLINSEPPVVQPVPVQAPQPVPVQAPVPVPVQAPVPVPVQAPVPAHATPEPVPAPGASAPGPFGANSTATPVPTTPEMATAKDPFAAARQTTPEPVPAPAVTTPLSPHRAFSVPILRRHPCPPPLRWRMPRTPLLQRGKLPQSLCQHRP